MIEKVLLEGCSQRSVALDYPHISRFGEKIVVTFNLRLRL